MDCCLIGRDLIRLLSAVAKITEIERLWSDLIHKPQVTNIYSGYDSEVSCAWHGGMLDILPALRKYRRNFINNSPKMLHFLNSSLAMGSHNNKVFILFH